MASPDPAASPLTPPVVHETPPLRGRGDALDAPVSPPWYKSYRWWICALLFLATTINYLDRQALGMLKPMLAVQLNWTEADYGWMQFAFTAAYAIGFFFAGRVVDVMGVR